MAKIDLRKEFRHLYLPSAKKISEVQLPPLIYLMIDGRGDPDHSVDCAAAVDALFPVSYAAKFTLRKKPGGLDYAVMPLEGLWWADDMAWRGKHHEIYLTDIRRAGPSRWKTVIRYPLQ